MPKVSSIDLLPEDIRMELATGLKGSGWGDIDGWTAWLAEHGFEIGRSTVGRFNTRTKRKFQEAWQDAEQTAAMAKILVAEKTDNAAMLHANEILASDGLLRFQIALREIEALAEQAETAEDQAALVFQIGKAHSSITRAVADLNRAGIVRAKWQTDMRAKLDSTIAGMAARGGDGPLRLDSDTLEAVRREVYGLIG
jgi:hypothetical protein